MALKISEKMRGIDPRFFSKLALLVTILPLWALWVYTYATFKTLQGEVEALSQFYGMFSYKDNLGLRLERAAGLMTYSEEQMDWAIEEGRAEDLSGESWERYDLLFGAEEALIVVERSGLHVLHPSEPPFASAEFLGEPLGREAFLRTLRQIVDQGLKGGFFSIDTDDDPGRSSRRSWFLRVAPVGDDLVCVLSVPEEKVRLSGGILEEAQKDLVRERRRRFVRLTLPVVVLSSLFIAILYRQSSRPSSRGRGM